MLNKCQSANTYADSETTTSSTGLFARVEVNVDDYGAPLIPLLEGYDPPLWAAADYEGDHFITLYGYASNDAWIQYDDPIDYSALYGRHVTNKSYIYAGMNDDLDGNLNDELVW